GGAGARFVAVRGGTNPGVYRTSALAKKIGRAGERGTEVKSFQNEEEAKIFARVKEGVRKRAIAKAGERAARGSYAPQRRAPFLSVLSAPSAPLLSDSAALLLGFSTSLSPSPPPATPEQTPVTSRGGHKPRKHKGNGRGAGDTLLGIGKPERSGKGPKS
ncbi:hypothetical protein TrRE_jg12631, partial [Triparma retinervis]